MKKLFFVLGALVGLSLVNRSLQDHSNRIPSSTDAPVVAGKAPVKNGRLVVFADKKIGAFKTDKSIKPGGNDSLADLKAVDNKQGVHACFIGSPDSIKAIFDGMIANTNKAAQSPEDLKLKDFSSEKGQSTLNIEVDSKIKNAPYLQMKIDPC